MVRHGTPDTQQCNGRIANEILSRFAIYANRIEICKILIAQNEINEHF